jgi:hypothetical protein
MFCVPATERVFWRTDTSTVWVGYADDGALVFNGLDRAYLDGYECAHVDEIMARGERAWLDDHGIERDFSC